MSDTCTDVKTLGALLSRTLEVEQQLHPELRAHGVPAEQVKTGVADLTLFRNLCPQAAGSRAPKVLQILDRLIMSSAICSDNAPHFVLHSCETLVSCAHTAGKGRLFLQHSNNR